MVAPKTFKMSFRDVFVESPSLTFFLAGDDEAEKTDTKATWVLRWKGAWDAQPISIRASSLTLTRQPQTSILFLGLDGLVARWRTKQIEYEAIDRSDDGPQTVGPLREIRTIDGQAFAVGMGRTAYRCDGPGHWVRIDSGLREADDAEGDAGLNSIDGFSADELVAVGWDGEIWQRSNGAWTQLPSPTNFALHKVLCLPQRRIVACGQRGTILISSNDQWHLVEQELTQDDFWSMAYFKGSIYLATLNALYQWNEDSFAKVDIVALDPVRSINTSPKDCFYRVHTDGQVLWSIGRKMAMYSSDGLRWTEVPYA